MNEALIISTVLMIYFVIIRPVKTITRWKKEPKWYKPYTISFKDREWIRNRLGSFGKWKVPLSRPPIYSQLRAIPRSFTPCHVEIDYCNRRINFRGVEDYLLFHEIRMIATHTEEIIQAMEFSIHTDRGAVHYEDPPIIPGPITFKTVARVKWSRFKYRVDKLKWKLVK